MSEKKPIRIELTEEQKQQIREATGKEASAVEFTAEELEDRVSPTELGVRKSPTELGIRKSPNKLGKA